MKKYKCPVCGFVYDEALGILEKGIAPGTKWDDIPSDFACPICKAPKSSFTLQEDDEKVNGPDFSLKSRPTPDVDIKARHAPDIKDLSTDEISAICSSLAKGCEKQRLTVEMEAFNKLADFFKPKTKAGSGAQMENAAKMLDDDLKIKLAVANVAAKADGDRGALRSLVWSEKVSTMMKALHERFAIEGEAMLQNTKIYVCEICGFIYIGDAPPEICPVCKVPNFKITEVERS